jgi:signal transduction histidine kinase/CheY-like chemotaxis protein
MINRRKDGTLFPVDATITPLRSPAGEVVNVVATLRDVTREVQLEEQIRHAQKMEAVGQLAGGIAHDFNNLLTVIQMSSTILQRQMYAEDPLLEHVLEIQSTITRAANLTGQLLNFSRREVSRQQVVDLNHLIDDLDWMLRRLVGSDVKLVKSLALDLQPVQAAPSELEQVLVNLVVNARDAMPKGGTLTLETANTALDEAYAAEYPDARPGAHVVLTVSDTGVGINDEVKPRIFEPFFTTKKRGEGTGLGLATVFGIVKQNGGHILVDSSVGQGTTFQVFLPSGDRIAAPAEPRPAVVSDRASVGQTILVVEDEELVRNLTARMLRSRGYQVHVAGSGQEALQISEQCNGGVHLLLADLHMPEMNGREVAQRLQSRWPQMRVLYMSGHSAAGGLVRRVLDGGAPFLPKPFDQDTLIEQVQAALDDD